MANLNELRSGIGCSGLTNALRGSNKTIAKIFRSRRFPQADPELVD
jgi:hypothetical protein